MSTRGLWGIRKNGIDKLTYNHSDSYPEWLGRKIVEFISHTSLPDLNSLYDKLVLVDEDKDRPTPEQKRICKKLGLYDKMVSTGSDDEWYCLLRNTQMNFDFYRQLAEDSEVKEFPFIDDASFIKDSLFCEYAYIIDLDNGKLEFYVGFQEKPTKGNRYGTTPDGDGYYPCKCKKRIPLEEIYKEPEKWVAYMKKGGKA